MTDQHVDHVPAEPLPDAAPTFTAATSPFSAGQPAPQPFPVFSAPVLSAPPGPPVLRRDTTLPLAYWSFGLGLGSIVLSFVTAFLAPLWLAAAVLAVVFGHVALKRFARRPAGPARSGRWAAITGLIAGYLAAIGTLSLIVIAVLFIAALSSVH